MRRIRRLMTKGWLSKIQAILDDRATGAANFMTYALRRADPVLGIDQRAYLSLD
ncbi:MAG: hypothetical protein ABIU05_09475 [Nitrospirales bacterium]